jgi:hypothetical protein
MFNHEIDSLYWKIRHSRWWSMISKYSVMHNDGIGKDTGPYLYIYILVY